MEPIEVILRYVKSQSNPDRIDYDFYWRLFIWYIESFAGPVFAIPYFLKIEGQIIAMSYKIDLNEVTYSKVVEDLYNLEKNPSFVGFQIPNEAK
jgi:hypothetical protein